MKHLGFTTHRYTYPFTSQCVEAVGYIILAGSGIGRRYGTGRKGNCISIRFMKLRGTQQYPTSMS